MVSFRRGKNKAEMEEKSASAHGAAGGEVREPVSQGEGVRVNDRRRLRVEEPGGGEEPREESAEAASEPRVKPTYVEELEARTRAAEQQARDVQTRFEQVRSELRRETDELRQRLNRNADERVQREKANFVASLLPVVDNLRRAVEAAEGGGPWESLLDGLRGTISGFESALAAAGAEPIEAAPGQPFDPEQHEAVDTTEVDPALDNTVTAQYGRGYRMGAQLLRPARVQVGRSRGDAQEAVG